MTTAVSPTSDEPGLKDLTIHELLNFVSPQAPEPQVVNLIESIEALMVKAKIRNVSQAEMATACLCSALLHCDVIAEDQPHRTRSVIEEVFYARVKREYLEQPAMAN